MAVRDVIQSAAGSAGDSKTYIEDVFSTYLYTGNGATQTVNNGIDLAGKGGMVWIKGRSNATNNFLFDTARGALNEINSNDAEAQASLADSLTAFNSNGFSLGSAAGINVNTATYASWTFRKAPKFFDVVTYTGNGSTSPGGKQVLHSLGATPGFVIIKRMDTTANWVALHRSAPTAGRWVQLYLNTAGSLNNEFIATSMVTSTYIDVASLAGGSNGTLAELNANGGSYVAYLFAHDTTTDGLIQCGSYTGNGSATGPTVTLGWEPQYLMIKKSSSTGSWQIIDNMRGMPVGSAEATLQANLSNAESSVEYVSPTATGFQITSTNTEVNTSGATYIYMAIRRGPMRTPTDGTKVFQPTVYTGNGSVQTINTGSVTPDLQICKNRISQYGSAWYTRILGFPGKWLRSDESSAEYSYGSPYYSIYMDQMNGFRTTSASAEANNNGETYVGWSLRRAPGFFDVVCYTGTGAVRTVNHNLEVAPELMLVKRRNLSMDWAVYNNSIGNTQSLMLNGDFGAGGSAAWNSTSPTKSVFTVSGVNEVNTSGYNYVAYLFASCPGVSKVGSYTGNGTSQTINCGFAAGARFVLIKRTNSTGGDWYVWDAARGIITGNDPHLSLNTPAAEVTADDTIDPTSTGFIVNQVAATNVNVSGGSYIYLAIA